MFNQSFFILFFRSFAFFRNNHSNGSFFGLFDSGIVISWSDVLVNIFVNLLYIIENCIHKLIFLSIFSYNFFGLRCYHLRFLFVGILAPFIVDLIASRARTSTCWFKLFSLGLRHECSIWLGIL